MKDAREDVIFSPPKPPRVEGETTEEDASCICNEGWGNGERDMLDCEGCHKWFHSDCVGVPATEVI